MDERGNEEEANKQIKEGKGLCKIRMIELMRQMFARAALNVFISPQQAEIHRKVLGDVIEPYHLLTPPIDTEHFKKISKIHRKKSHVVSMSGKIHHWVKGKGNLQRHIKWEPGEGVGSCAL
jgi:hypothetical protein